MGDIVTVGCIVGEGDGEFSLLDTEEGADGGSSSLSTTPKTTPRIMAAQTISRRSAPSRIMLLRDSFLEESLFSTGACLDA